MEAKKIIDPFIKENPIIFKKFYPISLIGTGSFGKIYSGIDIKKKEKVAIKVSKINVASLESEAFNLYNLRGFGIPKLISYGKKKNYSILIETLLGKSLKDLFFEKNKKFNLTDTCLIAIQLIERIKFIHSKDLVYRDIKPSNILIGIDDPENLYIVDFGTCKKYRSSRTKKHILPKVSDKFTGTSYFASANALKGKEYSRRDDLISLGFMLIYFLKGNLPWGENLQDLSINDYYKMIEMKENIIANGFLDDLPKEIKDYIKFVNNMKFETEPNYGYLSSLFNNVLNCFRFKQEKLIFSWINKNENKLKIVNNCRKNSRTNLRGKILDSISRNIIKAHSLNIASNEINHFKKINTCQFNISSDNDLDTKSKKLNNKNIIIIPSTNNNFSYLSNNINITIPKKYTTNTSSSFSNPLRIDIKRYRPLNKKNLTIKINHYNPSLPKNIIFIRNNTKINNVPINQRSLEHNPIIKTFKPIMMRKKILNFKFNERNKIFNFHKLSNSQNVSSKNLTSFTNINTSYNRSPKKINYNCFGSGIYSKIIYNSSPNNKKISREKLVNNNSPSFINTIHYNKVNNINTIYNIVSKSNLLSESNSNKYESNFDAKFTNFFQKKLNKPITQKSTENI